MQQRARVQVKVWGEYACFTRPEFKVERISYPLITPSAARGVLEAIFWKPEFRYEIRKIGVLQLGKQYAILRNELMNKQSRTPILIEKDRAQRTSLILKDVAYLITADIVLKPRAVDPVFKYRDQFNRRVERGQYHHTPYLGTREFAAYFSPVDADDVTQSVNIDVGTMLFDFAFIEDDSRKEVEFLRHDEKETRVASGFTQPLFFEACVEDGWLNVPQEKYMELYRLEGEDAL
ncbi:type I-C CRISPR-associated protein Cas5 [Caldalkalibacillus thermarum]|uniref:type I-C CRISPR-associated protein Cas5c n=1 Tax=Caldalkalibacillus thermarum TaxID=296745 RepID=UPI00166F512B|nr:type I-C CRISPR-associated protein Cas5c [Caldalkalibacillus thermarum]GGK34731.1 type I-C CRISPR-associated protein Cas5 [Caldalkalibacillus thermarum]